MEDTMTINTNNIYQYPSLVYPSYAIDEEPDSLICEAVHNITGPCYIKESFVPDSVISEEFNMAEPENSRNIALHAYFEELNLFDISLSMDVFDYLYHDSPSGPFLESWTRDPETALHGTATVNIIFPKQNPNTLLIEPKELSIYKVAVSGTLEYSGEDIVWVIRIDAKNLYYKLELLLESYLNLHSSFLQFTDLQIEKLENLDYYFKTIQNQAVTSSNTYRQSLS